MENTWTRPQQTVIDLRDRNILVSAAAGSGKTAVLVERIVRMVTNPVHPMDIDRLLVVTFSNAAASEMRERILAAIDEKAKESPQNLHLQKQLTYIHNANITTIHSFALNVIRDHFNYLEIDPAFSVGEEGELKLMREDVLKELLEEYYQNRSYDFLQFVEQYAGARSDHNLEEMILKLYQFSMSYPQPEQWLGSCLDAYEVQDADGLIEQPWMKWMLAEIRTKVEGMAKKIDFCMELAEQEDGPHMYRAAVAADQEFLNRLLQAEDYEEMGRLLAGYAPVTLGRAKKTDTDISPAKKAEVKQMRDEVKKQISTLKKKNFQTSLQEQVEVMGTCKATVAVMVELTQEFMHRFQEKKAEKNVLDFYDLEHYALKVLLAEDSNGNLVPTKAADELALQYDEVMVDEYQDSNMVQELLVKSVSRERFGQPDMFMVGDVKQSIYKFRLARPELFMEKYRTFPHIESISEDDQRQGVNRRINLDRNFRSRMEVLQATNFIFRQIMRESLGGISYDDENALYPGASYPPPPQQADSRAELLLLETKLAEEDKERWRDKSAKELEAQMIARRIHRLIKEYQVYDKSVGGYRPCRYSDIVILLRSISGSADVYSEALENEGIPAYCELQTGYFDAMEVTTILNMLRIIDNPRQDIPLISVLTSPMFGLSDTALAQIRSAFPQLPYHEAVQKYCEAGYDQELQGVLKRFYGLLDKYRNMAPHCSIYQLITALLDDTGYYHYMQAMPGGKRRTANIDMLKEKAVDYEKSSYHGLFHYVRYIEKIKQYQLDMGEASTISENENTVRIMSIHKSKGLEFPVVFVSGLGQKFNKMDSYQKVVMHSDLGIGIDGIYPEQRLRVNTLIRQAIGKKVELDSLGEELRVLYVALTRAREKLILTGTVTDIEKAFTKWAECRFEQEWKISYEMLTRAGNALDFVGYALARNRAAYPLYDMCGMERPWRHLLAEMDSGIVLQTCGAEDMLVQTVEKMASQQEFFQNLLSLENREMYHPECREELHRKLDFIYPYQEATQMPSKLSVTELKERYLDEVEENRGELFYEERISPHVPKFLSREKGLSAAARGTAFHRILELFDYTLEPEEENYRRMAEQLCAAGKLDADQCEAIAYDKLVAFAKSPLGQRMKRAALEGKLHREAKFIFSISDEKALGSHEGETILIQGIIDAYFVEPDGVVIVDYKTDQVRNMEELEDRYGVQLNYYGQALERLTGCKVKQKMIYSIYLSQEQEVLQ